jgi:hypothetical protein
MKKAFSRVSFAFCFVLFSVLFFSNTLLAQDSIVLLNNSVILAKVEEIDVDNIKYHKADNISGPLYDLPKSQIFEIIYINGTVDVMNPQSQNGQGQQSNQNQQINAVPYNGTSPTGQDPTIPNSQSQPTNESQQNNTYQQDNSIQNNQGQSNQQYNSGQPNQPDNSNQQNQQNNGGQQDNSYANSDQPQAQPQAGPVTMQTFYDQLAPYGNWVNSPAYGYVWVPDVGADFVPYGTAGHWAFTDYGWTWVSDFPWGWATFHYGSWYYDYSMGYVWIPATQWGPAWVSWRSNEGYYGWAPMGPSGYAYPQDRWVFVNAGYISNERVYEHYEPRQNVTVIYNNTTVVQNSYVERNGVRYVAGPDRAEVERVTHTTIIPAKIVSNNQPGQAMQYKGLINMYHPAVQAENTARPSKPAVVTPAEQVAPPAQRTTVVHPVVNNVHSTPAQQPVNNKRNEVAPEQHSVPFREITSTPAPQQQQAKPAQQQQKPAQQQQQKQPKPKSAPKPVPPQPEKKK